MKIIQGRFPEEQNWKEYLVGRTSGLATDFENMNRVFLYRVAAFARDLFVPEYGEKIYFGGTYRSILWQAEAYQRFKTGQSSTLTAAPGSSWHNYGLAVDLQERSHGKSLLRNDHNSFVNNGVKTQNIYKNYGFCFTVRSEQWHIQPIETIEQNMASNWKTRGFFLDDDDYFQTKTGYRFLELSSSNAIHYDSKERIYVVGNDVKLLQSFLSLKETGIYDEETSAAVKEFQLRNDITASGKCDQSTWEAILKGNYIPVRTYYPSSGNSTTTYNPETSIGQTKYDEEIGEKEWQSYYTGENGVAATIYLEKVRNLETQEKRTEELSIARAKAELLNQSHIIEDTKEYNDLIDKWETILNSKKSNDLVIEDIDRLLYQSDSPYPTADTSLSREAYISSVLATITHSSDLSNKSNYDSIFNIEILRDKVTPVSLDRDDPWIGIARKDVLAALYFLLIEMQNNCNKNGQYFSKIAVSLARNLELNKSQDQQSLEHYCGLAGDVYLPKTVEGVIIIKAEDVVDILFSMGIKNIGIALDYVHFDLAGNTENIWSIENYPVYDPKFITLETTKMKVPQVFL